MTTITIITTITITTINYYYYYYPRGARGGRRARRGRRRAAGRRGPGGLPGRLPLALGERGSAPRRGRRPTTYISTRRICAVAA